MWFALQGFTKIICCPLVTDDGDSKYTLHYKLGMSDFKCKDLCPDSVALSKSNAKRWDCLSSCTRWPEHFLWVTFDPTLRIHKQVCCFDMVPQHQCSIQEESPRHPKQSSACRHGLCQNDRMRQPTRRSQDAERGRPPAHALLPTPRHFPPTEPRLLSHSHSGLCTSGDRAEAVKKLQRDESVRGRTAAHSIKLPRATPRSTGNRLPPHHQESYPHSCCRGGHRSKEA